MLTYHSNIGSMKTKKSGSVGQTGNNTGSVGLSFCLWQDWIRSKLKTFCKNSTKVHALGQKSYSLSLILGASSGE
jgi:hypothetical protein